MVGMTEREVDLKFAMLRKCRRSILRVRRRKPGHPKLAECTRCLDDIADARSSDTTHGV